MNASGSSETFEKLSEMTVVQRSQTVYLRPISLTTCLCGKTARCTLSPHKSDFPVQNFFYLMFTIIVNNE